MLLLEPLTALFYLFRIVFVSALARIQRVIMYALFSIRIDFECCLRFCKRVHFGSREIYCTDCNSMVVFVLSEDIHYTRQIYIIHEFNWFKCKYLAEILWLELPKWEFGRRFSLIQKWYVHNVIYIVGVVYFCFLLLLSAVRIKYERQLESCLAKSNVLLVKGQEFLKKKSLLN